MNIKLLDYVVDRDRAIADGADVVGDAVQINVINLAIFVIAMICLVFGPPALMRVRDVPDQARLLVMDILGIPYMWIVWRYIYVKKEVVMVYWAVGVLMTAVAIWVKQ